MVNSDLQRLKTGERKAENKTPLRKQKTTRNSICATFKRWKRGDDNELERNLRLEKVVISKQLRLAVEIEEEGRARPENDAATKQLRLAMEMDE